MSFNELDLKRYGKVMELFIEKRRPPKQIRDEVDLSYKFEKTNIIIFEIRPQWKDPSKIIEIPIAKTMYVKQSRNWKIYWQKSDLKWHSYDPCPIVETLEEFIEIVDRDEFACFWG
jgi:hypothetical protein